MNATFQRENEDPETITGVSFTRAIAKGTRITWNFEDIHYKLTIVTTGGGKAAFEGGSYYSIEQSQWCSETNSLRIAAKADAGYAFRYWRGDVAGIDDNFLPELTVPMNQARVLTAVFEPETTITADSYIHDGLYLHLDGLSNAGRDENFALKEHTTTALCWMDLRHDAMVTNTVGSTLWPWSANGLSNSSYNNNVKPRLPAFLLDWSVPKTFETHFDQTTLSKVSQLFYVNLSSPLSGAEQQQLTADNKFYFQHQGIGYDSAAHTFYASGTMASIVESDYYHYYASQLGKWTSIRQSTPSGVTSNDFFVACRSSDNYSLLGTLYALRIYDKKLSEHELMWNEFVDRYRYRGGDSTKVAFYVWPLLSEFGLTSSPAFGTTNTVTVGSSQAFSISGLSTHPDDSARAREYATGKRAKFYGWRVDNGGPSTSYHHTETSGSTESDSASPKVVLSTLTWDIRRQFRLTVGVTSGGRVRLSGSAYTTEILQWYDDGETCTLTALPDSGCTFSNWEGPLGGVEQSFTNSTIVVPMDQVRDLRAVFVDPSRTPVTTRWIGADNSTGNWRDATKWDHGVPEPGDTAVITNAGRVTVVLDTPTAVLGSLVLENASGNAQLLQTLFMTNWNACLRADTVRIGRGGYVTCSGPTSAYEPSNRVWMAVGDLTVATNGEINVDKRGFKVGSGPGHGNHVFCTGTYGGVYGGYVFDTAPQPYGSAEWPTDLGSGGGGYNRTGGGAVLIEATGSVVIDGTISSKGDGSGGSVLITCRDIAGNGVVRANGRHVNTDTALGGGPGRVAVHYDPGAESNVTCNVRFEAFGGVGYKVSAATGSTVFPTEGLVVWDVRQNVALEDYLSVHGGGSLWFPDNQFLELPKYYTRGIRMRGLWCGATPLEHLVWKEDAVLDCSYLEFTNAPFAVTAEKNLTLTGEGCFARRENALVVSNANVTVGGDLHLTGARLGMIGAALKVAGNVLQDEIPESTLASVGRFRGGNLSVRAAPVSMLEEGAEPIGTDPVDVYVGATVEIGKTWTMKTNAVTRPKCDPTDGTVVAFTARYADFQLGSHLDADTAGYSRGPEAAGNGDGNGAGYGGKGGDKYHHGRNPYGSAEYPFHAGSGGCPFYYGHIGGGAVNLTVLRKLTLNGLISADAHRYSVSTHNGGASGGGIYVKARSFTGDGYLTAYGGHGGPIACYAVGVTGGGGRIAVWTRFNDWDETKRAEHADATAGYGVTDQADTKWSSLTDHRSAAVGTVYWGTYKGEPFAVMFNQR